MFTWFVQILADEADEGTEQQWEHLWTVNDMTVAECLQR